MVAEFDGMVAETIGIVAEVDGMVADIDGMVAEFDGMVAAVIGKVAGSNRVEVDENCDRRSSCDACRRGILRGGSARRPASEASLWWDGCWTIMDMSCIWGDSTPIARDISSACL